jgi:predicted aspartyl protease
VTFPFDPTQPKILVQAKFTGPGQTVAVEFILDTGASDTFVDESWIALAGYTQAHATSQHQVLTGGGQITVLEVPLLSITVLGQTRTSFPVLAHSFPPGTSHDGVLGLDFLRGNVLTIDFVKGEITLTPGGPTP